MSEDQQEEGRYFEDFKVGEKRTFGAYEVTREEIIEFAGKYDPQPFHMSEELARDSFLGGLCASGWHTCAMTMRMMVDSMMDKGPSLGSPGVDGIRWLRPVRPGDVLSVEIETKELRPSRSKPDIGSVHQDVTVMNQKGEAVMTLKSVALFKRRSPGAS